MKRQFLFSLFLVCCVNIIAHSQSLPKYIPYKKGSLWGYCDSNRSILIQPQWQEVNLFYKGNALVKNNEGSYCLIDTNGKYTLPPEWHWNGQFQSRTLNAIDSNGKMGMVDTNFKLAIPLVYDKKSASIRDGYFFYKRRGSLVMLVNLNDRPGIINEQNDIIVPFEYDSISINYFPYQSKYILVIKNGMKGVVDLNKQITISCNYDDIRATYDSQFIVKNKNGYGLLGENNKVIIPCQYDNITLEGNNSVLGYKIEKNGLFGWCDYHGKWILPLKYDQKIRLLTNSLISIKRPFVKNEFGKTGLTDKNGKTIFRMKYDDFEVFNDTIKVTKQTVAYSRYEYDAIRRIRYYNATTYKPIGKWVYDTTKFPICTSPNDPWCGTINYKSPDYYFPNNESEVDWLSTKKEMVYLKIIGRILRKYYILEGHSREEPNERYFALAESNQKFIVPPQTKYQFIKFDCEGNLFLVNRTTDKLWGVVDSNLNVKIDFQEKYLQAVLTWKQKHYAIHDELIDSTGITLSNFRKRRIVSYSDSIGRDLKRAKFDGYFLLKDSVGNVGLVSIGNKICYPRVSFKYKEMTGIVKGLFKVKDSTNRLRFIDMNNNEIFPGMKLQNDDIATTVHDFNHAEYSKDWGLEPYEGNPLLRKPLLIIVRYISSEDKISYFCVGRNGTIFADSLDYKHFDEK